MNIWCNVFLDENNFEKIEFFYFCGVYLQWSCLNNDLMKNVKRDLFIYCFFNIIIGKVIYVMYIVKIDWQVVFERNVKL